MCVDGKGIGWGLDVGVVFDANVDLRIVDVELYGGTNSLQLDYLVRGRDWN